QIGTSADNFYVELSFIGFVNQSVEEFEINDGRINLGTIRLSANSSTLDEVTVRAERSQTEFKLDKRVFNVGQDLSSTGASALEILNNVPSVTVSIEGDIALRGSSGVQILINGKPSVLSEGGNALGSITADMIEKVEVITNPSAKYDAEGTTGIINIVLRKEEKKGINGSVTLNTGFPNNHSVGLSMNRRTEKFNLFTQLGVGYRSMPRESRTINRNLLTNDVVQSFGDGDKNETFYNFILGTDYHINKNNVLTLSGSFAYEQEKEVSITEFSELEEGSRLVREWNRNELTTAGNPKYQYELQYKSDFEDHKDHALLFSAIGRFFGKDQQSEFDNITSLGSLQTTEQNVRTDFKDAHYTFKLDYTRPLSETFTVETGAQYLINNVGNDYAVEDLIDGDWVPNIALTNNFEFSQKVLGTYATAAFEGEKWGLKTGLRLEHTDLDILLTTTGENGDQDYFNLFPSAHTSYKVNQQLSFQAGYSRRIFRPRMWDLNPFFNIRNNFNVRTGNPNLMPEFTDSYEINGIYIMGKSSLNVGVYHRYTTDVVERVTTFEDNVSTTMPLNIGTERTTGIEFNGKYSPNKKLTFTGDFNFNYFNRIGEFEGTNFDFDANRWGGRLRAKMKLPADIEMEVTGNYRSRVQNFQGVYSANTFADL
ncbi:MAG: TonB-dependent receptor, partial [Bacteroidota bacterium]